MKKLLLSIVVLTVSIQTLFSQDITGVWKGILDVRAAKLELYFTVSKVDLVYKVTMSVPVQNLSDFPLDSITYDNSELTIVSNIMNMRYRGKFLDGGFSGEFIQHGARFSLSLERGELPKSKPKVELKRPQEPMPPFPYKEENIVFSNEKHNIKLAGTLTIPNGIGPFRAIVLISGSGPQDRNQEILGHKPFLVIADYLTRNGIAVLRFDDRGIGESEGSVKGNATLDLSYDAEAAFNYLKTRNDISEIGLCGHSEGGMHVFMVAARNPNVDFIISMAGSGVSGADILLSQQRAIGKIMNLPPQMLDHTEKTNRGYYDIILNSKANDEAFKQELLAKIREDKSMTENNINIMLSAYIDPWMYSFVRYNPFDDIKKIKVPIFAFNGTVDLQVNAELNLLKIEEAARIGGNKNIRIEYLEGLNHLFQHSETGSISEYGEIEETFSIDVLEMMKKWILEQ